MIVDQHRDKMTISIGQSGVHAHTFAVSRDKLSSPMIQRVHLGFINVLTAQRIIAIFLIVHLAAKRANVLFQQTG